MLTQLFFVLSLLVATVYGQNAQDNGGVSQFINGQFTNTLSPWTAVNMLLATGSDSNGVPNFALSTPSSASFQSNLQASISQQVTVIESGETLTVTFWLKVVGNGQPQDFHVYFSFDGNILATQSSSVDNSASPVNGFYKNVFTLTAPNAGAVNGALTIKFASDNSNVVYYVDDVSITGSSAFVVGDPQFIGLRGQSYQVHGVDGHVYNLISSTNTQVNSKFVFLSNGECPVIGGMQATNCWSHPGSYLGSIGIQQIVDGKTHQLSLVSGPATEGFASVTLNGKALSVGAQFSDSSLFSVSYHSPYSIRVKTEEFSFTFENSDMFINQGVVARVPLSALTAHGLFGQTHERKVYNSALKYIAGDVDDYVVIEGNLFGKDFVYNQFQL